MSQACIALGVEVEGETFDDFVVESYAGELILSHKTDKSWYELILTKENVDLERVVKNYMEKLFESQGFVRGHGIDLFIKTNRRLVPTFPYSIYASPAVAKACPDLISTYFKPCEAPSDIEGMFNTAD